MDDCQGQGLLIGCIGKIMLHNATDLAHVGTPACMDDGGMISAVICK